METKVKGIEYRRFVGQEVFFMENGFVKEWGTLTTVYNENPKMTFYFKVKDKREIAKVVISLNDGNKYELKSV